MCSTKLIIILIRISTVQSLSSIEGITDYLVKKEGMNELDFILRKQASLFSNKVDNRTCISFDIDNLT